MKNERLIVIGGDAAGLSAASKAKRENPELEVIVFEKQEYISFGLCGLPYYISGVVENLEDLLAVSPEEFREKRDIDVKLEHEVTKIKPDEKSLVVKHKAGEEFEMDYDKLLIATGVHARTPHLENMDLDNIFTLHWLNDGKKIRNFIQEENPQKVVVTSGYIGLEMAEAFRKLGLDVSAVAKYEDLLPMVDPEIAEPLEEVLSKHDVDLYKEHEITGFEGNEENEVKKVVTSKGEIDADFVLLSVGVVPNVELAEEAGIKTGETGGIVVNERMETNLEGIYAAGDCIETTNIISEDKVNIPLGDVANRQGRIAGTNIAGGDASFPGVLGTAITKVFELGVARTGLSEKEAKKSDFDYITTTINHGTRAFYYPGGTKLTIKLIVEKDTGRLTGAQMAGEEGVGQRIDVLASLIYNQNTVQEIQNLDLAYAPPFSPAWDPIQTAAKVAASKLEK